MRKTSWILTGIIVLAFLLRIGYCWNLPLSGDESISLLQATGKATDPQYHPPLEPTPIPNLISYLNYTPGYGPGRVLESMEKAGMHPPLYYLLLHYFLRWIGNEVHWIRLFSVLFSTGAILPFFFLIRELRTNKEALFGALLMAVNFHSIRLAGMVRPYPLLVFLSLLSTWLLFCFHGNLEKKFKNPWLWFYALTALAGLYTLNHFAYVMAAQMGWVIAMNYKRIRLLGAPLVAASGIGLGYLPWLKALLFQIRVVNSGDYYFHGQAMPIKFLIVAYEQLFTETWSERFHTGWFLIGATVFCYGIYSLYCFWKNRRSRSLLFLIALYAVIHVLADWILNMQTFTSWKFLFFMVPLILVILAGGSNGSIQKKILSKGIATVILTALLFTTIRGFCRVETYDGPICLTELKKIIENPEIHPPTLVMINNPNGRFALSTAAVLDEAFDLIAHSTNTPQVNMTNEKIYDFLICINFGKRCKEELPELNWPFPPAANYQLLEKRGCENKYSHEELQLFKKVD